MQKILQTDEIISTEALRKGKRKRTETMDSENANNDMDKGQRVPYSGNAFLPGESSSEDEIPLAELSKEELCAKIKSLKEKLTNTRKENSRLRQSLVMLQVLPQAVAQFEELVGLAETLLKGGGAVPVPAPVPAPALWRATYNSSPDSFASTCSNSASASGSPLSLKVEDEHPPDEKQEGLSGPVLKYNDLICGDDDEPNTYHSDDYFMIFTQKAKYRGVQEISHTLEAQRIQPRVWIPQQCPTQVQLKDYSPRPHPQWVHPVAWSSQQCLMLVYIEDVHLKGPKASGKRQKTYASGGKDLCHQAEGSTLEPGSDAHDEGQSSPDENSSHS
ncbi:BEN domain-containing protein 6 isoform X1 [Heterocephalus glaber]|uniref:BEN domain-containing protein 6 isoform X1 n=1 Tax=Heterocephalus glaber TaxID=10181 RepID=A0AAX6SZV4_HETGA|nr:BEN domain-containing protein 6 isoform X1 [Heterocephalus glaber]XP_021115053.1 BEN domain-containing protein 6 isoform X1 [Heterocephalus glaber]